MTMSPEFRLLLKFAEQYQGRSLPTLGKRSFFVLEVSEDAFIYTPVKTNSPRRQTFVHASRVFERYRETGSLKTSNYTDLTVNSSYILALIKAYSENGEPARKDEKVREFSADAIEDLNEIPLDVEEPEKTTRTSSSYARDPKVRAYVIARAKGACEFCGEKGFLMVGGMNYYLEAHHVIALADDGKDTLANVIALCPKHHREAHFGINRNEIEAEMTKLLRALSKKTHNKAAARRR